MPYQVEGERLPREVDDGKRISETRRTSERLQQMLAPYWECLRR
jgi:hypothetical protein